MSRLGCTCGHTIRDQSDNIPYKAKFIRDQDFENYYSFTNDISSFIDAIKNGQRDEWIQNYFSNGHPTDISNSSIIFDIITNYDLRFDGDIYQCENCGRVKIQVQDKNLFSSFLPEDEWHKDIFKGFHNSENSSR